MFYKQELRLLVPNCQRINRGGYELGQLVGACRSNGVTDLLIIQEHRGEPDGLVICHLPYGPTAYFTISGTVMRHDIPYIGQAPQQYPHLVFHNFKTNLGCRVSQNINQFNDACFSNKIQLKSFLIHCRSKISSNIYFQCRKQIVNEL